MDQHPAAERITPEPTLEDILAGTFGADNMGHLAPRPVRGGERITVALRGSQPCGVPAADSADGLLCRSAEGPPVEGGDASLFPVG